MRIEVKRFGTMLISRPAGKEAFASARAYLLPAKIDDGELLIDFAGVEVLSPSWADEFLSGIKKLYGGIHLSYVNTENPSVKETLEILSSASVN